MNRYNYKFALRTIYGRAYPRIWGVLREPSWVLFEILLPVILLLHSFMFLEALMQIQHLKPMQLLVDR